MAHKSVYNYIFKREDDSYGCFNTLTGALVVFDTFHKNEFDKIPNQNINIDTDFKKQLLDLGFICDDNMDEKELVDISRYRRSFLQNSAYFRILTTTGCNARCEYCYEKGAEVKNMSIDTAKDVVNFIMKRSNVEKIYIHWFGGEPLLNTKVIDYIMEKLYDKLIKKGVKVCVYFTSNGSLLNDENIEKAKKMWHANWFQITIDDIGQKYDKIKNYYNSKYNYDLIIDNIKKLANQNIPVKIRINYCPENIENTKRIIKVINDELHNYLEKNIITINPAPIFNVINDFNNEVRVGLNCKYMNLIRFAKQKEYKIDSFMTDLSFKGGQCFACHQGSFIVDPNGDLFKCTLTINNKNTSVGNVREGLKLTKEYFSWIDPKLPDKCEECKFLPICQGGCRGGYFGYIDYMCNRLIPEINDILEEKIKSGAKINDITLDLANDDITLN